MMKWKRWPHSRRHPAPLALNDQPRRRVTFWLERQHIVSIYGPRMMYGASILAWAKYGNAKQQAWVCFCVFGKLHFFKLNRRLLHLFRPINNYVPGTRAPNRSE